MHEVLSRQCCPNANEEKTQCDWSSSNCSCVAYEGTDRFYAAVIWSGNKVSALARYRIANEEENSQRHR